MPSTRFPALVLFQTSMLFASSASAQIRASEIGTVSQIVDGTRITVTYSRPRTRGRDVIFGAKAVRWDATWTPGANWATTFTTTKDLTLNGKRVGKGTYSVWMIPRSSGEWTFILDPDSHRFHENPPDSNARQIRTALRVEQAPALDVLTWSFPELRVSGGTIAMQWATTRAAMSFQVDPSLPITMAEGDAKSYLGRYEGRNVDPKQTEKWDFVLTYEDGVMKGQFDPNEPYMGKFAMIQLAPDIFTAGLYDKNGQIYEVLRPDMIITFTRMKGKVETFEIRNDSDILESTGRKR